MLKRKIGDNVNINPYYNTSGTIMTTKEQPDKEHDLRYDYKMKWNHEMEAGVGKWTYYNEDELDKLEKNWNMVKRVEENESR